jgi:two-component system response regulator MprA
MVLDLMLPGMDGIEVCRVVRTSSDLPILMLTARDGVADRVHGLDSGADDYLVKPFAHEELMARIRTLLRRQQPHNAVLLTCGDLVVDLDAHAVRRGDRPIELTAQEFRLLEHFVRHRERVLSRSQLLNAVWELETDTTSNVVDVYVRYLRQKLEEGDEVRLLHTIRGVGYVLRSPSERGLGQS